MSIREGKEINLGSGDFGINLTMSGEKEIMSFFNYLEKMANGDILYKFYKEQEALIQDIAEAARRVNEYGNEVDAKNLINSLNALRAITQEFDVSEMISGIRGISEAVEYAEETVGKFVDGNTVKNFEEIFKTFAFIEGAAGKDISPVLDGFADIGSVEKLKEELKSLQEELEWLNENGGLEGLKKKIEEQENSIYQASWRARNEFRSFLTANNLSTQYTDSEGNHPFANLLRQVDNFEISANQAITAVRDKYSHLLSDNGSLELSAENIEKIAERLNSGLANTSGQSSGVSELANELIRVLEASSGASGSIEELNSPLQELLSIIRDIGNIPLPSLESLKDIFGSISGMGGMQIDDSPFRTLADGLTTIKSALENVGNLNVLSNIRLDGLKDLKVSKASLNNLAEYLPRIANINSSNLSKLSRIDLSNFNSDRLKVSKASVNNLLSLVGVIDKLDELNKKIDTKADAIPAVAQIEEIPTIEEDIATEAEHAAEVMSEMPKAEQEIVPAAEQATQAIEAQAVAIDVVAESINNAANQAERYADAISAASSKSSNVEDINIKTRTSLERKSADLESRMIDQSKKFSGASPEDVESINDYISYIQILREEYKKAKIDSKNFSSAIDDVSARFSEWKVSIKESGGDTSLLTSGTKEYASAVGKLDSMLQTAITTKNSLTSIDSSKSSSLQSDIDSYIAGISNLSEELERGEITQTEFSNRSTILGHSLSSAATEAKQVVQTYRELNDAFNADTSSQKLNEQLLRRSSELQATMMNALASKSGAGEERIDELNGYINSLKNLRQQYKENIIGSEEFDSSIRRLSTSFSEWKTSIKESGNDTKLLVSGTKEYTNAVNKVDSLLQKATDAQNKFTAAKNGKSSDAYKDIDGYINRLKILDNQLESNTITQADYIKEVGNIEHGLSGAIRTIKEAGEDTQSLGDRLKNMTRSFSAWFSTTRIIMAAFRYFKQMVSASIELESSFAQLKIVTGATDEQMEQFANTAVSLAKGLGQSVSDVTKSIETFSRLGYNLTEASELSKFATILANTAAVSTEEATTGITSIIKGYNMKVSDAEHVADVLIQVGQKYAVSASEMMEAYEKSGAALNATNTSFEKSAGLIASANAAVQNASTVGKLVPSITVM